MRPGSVQPNPTNNARRAAGGAGRQSQCRQERAVQRADRRAAEGRQLSGVTVERKAGRLVLDDGRPVELVDLPGAYSLDPASPDERVTRDVVTGTQAGERRPDALVVVVDARQSRQPSALHAAADRARPAGRGGAQHDRPGRARRADARPRRCSRANWACRWSRPSRCASAAWTSCKRGPLLDELLVGNAAPRAHDPAQEPIPQRHRRSSAAPARSRARPRSARRRCALAGATPSTQIALHPVAGLIAARRRPVRHVPGGILRRAQPPPTRSRPASTGWIGQVKTRDARFGGARAAHRRHDRRGRRGGRVPAADPDPVLLHPGARGVGLHGPRGVPDGPDDGARRPVGARVHPAVVVVRLRGARDHGDPHDRGREGPADDDPDRAADDVLGAAAGLYAGDRRGHPQRPRAAGRRACRGW